MPKKRGRDKRGKPPMRTHAEPKSRSAPVLHSVKELLARTSPALTRLTDETRRVSFWRAWLSQHLTAELGEKISGITERDGTLVVFAESAAWAARLRYALTEL